MHTQVIAYLRQLAAAGHEITLLTFEPDISLDAQSIKAKLEAEGIAWHWLPYHKRFSVLATAWDILRGTFFIRRFIAREKPDILHGRVHVPTLMGALARKVSRHKPRLLFDIRGFFPEEYTDAGVWPEGGFLYRMSKLVERWLLKESDGFVVLTEKARTILFPESRGSGKDKSGRPVEVIPCCVDLMRFSADTNGGRRAMRDELGVSDRLVIAYVGSFGGWYMTDEMIDLFAAAREIDPTSFAMILTQRGVGEVVSKLRTKGFADNDYYVGGVKSADMPRYLSAADIAVSFIKSCYSKQSSSPTKIAEYLACGLPVIANRGVGDVDALIENNQVGALVDDFTNESYRRALQLVTGLEGASERCRSSAEREFDLEKIGGQKYRRLYNRILEG